MPWRPKSLRSALQPAMWTLPSCAAKQVRLRRYTSTVDHQSGRHAITRPLFEDTVPNSVSLVPPMRNDFCRVFRKHGGLHDARIVMQCARRSINRFRSIGLRRSSSSESAPCRRFVWPSQRFGRSSWWAARKQPTAKTIASAASNIALD